MSGLLGSKEFCKLAALRPGIESCHEKPSIVKADTGVDASE
jgi:hypothetical protein